MFGNDDTLASEIMSQKLLTIGEDESMVSAHEIMKHRQIRHLPVFDEYGALVGILSDRDVQRSMNRESEVDPQAKVSHYMSWPVHTVHDDEPVVMVAQRMLSEKISAFVVRDGTGKIAGIVTTDDMLRLLISVLDRHPSVLKMSLRGVMSEYGLPAGNWA